MSENCPAVSGRGAPPRRARVTRHSTTIPNAVLLGYANLTDGARLTYLVLESYDWPDKDGVSKGCCWPSIETLATTRGKSYDTIGRHLKELETAGLIRIESGQDRGAANCYWLLGPSEQEFADYLDRFTESASSTQTSEEPSSEEISDTSSEEISNETYYGSSRLEEKVAPAVDLPQICGTYSRKYAGPGTANMREEEHEFKKLEIKKDSNPIPYRIDKGGSTFQNKTRSLYITKVIEDFSKILNDLPHALSNQSQAQNLFRQSGMDERAFVELLYEAKKRTQWAAIATPKTVGNGPNRAAYFFKVVRNLLEEKSCALAYP